MQTSSRHPSMRNEGAHRSDKHTSDERGTPRRRNATETGELCLDHFLASR
jgi:hypothetical protein